MAAKMFKISKNHRASLIWALKYYKTVVFEFEYQFLIQNGRQFIWIESN